jgi:hypothetical protein
VRSASSQNTCASSEDRWGCYAFRDAAGSNDRQRDESWRCDARKAYPREQQDKVTADG